MKFYSLISCIPNFMKKCIKENAKNVNWHNFTVVNNFFDTLMASKKPKFVYKYLRDQVFYAPNDKLLKWEEHLGFEIHNWSKYFVTLKKCCEHTYLKTFQYKILHRILPTNNFFYMVKLKNTKLCGFCIF